MQQVQREVSRLSRPYVLQVCFSGEKVSGGGGGGGMERLTETTSNHNCMLGTPEVCPASRFQLNQRGKNKKKKHPDCLASEGKRRVRSPPQGQRWQLQFPISCDFADWRVKIDAAPPSAADCQLLVVCCEQQLLQIFPVDEARNARALPRRFCARLLLIASGNVCFPKWRPPSPEGSLSARLKDAWVPAD